MKSFCLLFLLFSISERDWTRILNSLRTTSKAFLSSLKMSIQSSKALCKASFESFPRPKISPCRAFVCKLCKSSDPSSSIFCSVFFFAEASIRFCKRGDANITSFKTSCKKNYFGLDSEKWDLRFRFQFSNCGLMKVKICMERQVIFIAQKRVEGWHKQLPFNLDYTL